MPLLNNTARRIKPLYLLNVMRYSGVSSLPADWTTREQQHTDKSPALPSPPSCMFSASTSEPVRLLMLTGFSFQPGCHSRQTQALICLNIKNVLKPNSKQQKKIPCSGVVPARVKVLILVYCRVTKQNIPSIHLLEEWRIR